jgi:hypothetical protein
VDVAQLCDGWQDDAGPKTARIEVLVSATRAVMSPAVDCHCVFSARQHIYVIPRSRLVTKKLVEGYPSANKGMLGPPQVVQILHYHSECRDCSGHLQHVGILNL